MDRLMPCPLPCPLKISILQFPEPVDLYLHSTGDFRGVMKIKDQDGEMILAGCDVITRVLIKESKRQEARIRERDVIRKHTYREMRA